MCLPFHLYARSKQRLFQFQVIKINWTFDLISKSCLSCFFNIEGWEGEKRREQGVEASVQMIEFLPFLHGSPSGEKSCLRWIRENLNGAKQMLKSCLHPLDLNKMQGVPGMGFLRESGRIMLETVTFLIRNYVMFWGHYLSFLKVLRRASLVFLSILPHKCNCMVYALRFVTMFCFLDASANKENIYQLNQDLNLGHRLYYVGSTKM